MSQQNACNLFFCFEFASFLFTCNWLRDLTFGELLSITNDRNTRTKDDAIFLQPDEKKNYQVVIILS